MSPSRKQRARARDRERITEIYQELAAVKEEVKRLTERERFSEQTNVNLKTINKQLVDRVKLDSVEVCNILYYNDMYYVFYSFLNYLSYQGCQP